jgi:hypothetical protein
MPERAALIGGNWWFLDFAAGQRLEFRAELFNALNNPQFDDPVVTPGNNPVAGKIMSASDFGFTQTERVIQLGLKSAFSRSCFDIIVSSAVSR